MNDENAVANWSSHLGWLVLGTCAFTTVAIVLLHGLRPELNPFERAISDYVMGPYGSVMTVTFFNQGLGSVALAAALMRVAPNHRRILIGSLLFVVAAIGAVIAGVFPADPASPYSRTIAGTIHMVAGLVRFLALAIALPMLSAALGEHSRFSMVKKTLTFLGVLFAITFLVSIVFLANIDLFGLGQRTFIAILIIWMSACVYPIVRWPDS